MLDAAAFREGSQHKGCFVRSPLPCRGTLAPLRARVQRLYTKQWKGQAAIHPLPCFFSLPGVPELMPRRQVSRIRSPAWLSASFWLDNKVSWRLVAGRGLGLPFLPCQDQSHRSRGAVKLLHRREFCFLLASELIQRIKGRISTEDSFVYQGEIQKPLKLFTAGWKNNTKNKHCTDRYPDGVYRQTSKPLALLSFIIIYLSFQDFISNIYKAPNYDGFREMGVIMPPPSPLLCHWIEFTWQSKTVQAAGADDKERNGGKGVTHWGTEGCCLCIHSAFLWQFHGVPAKLTHCQNRLTRCLEKVKHTFRRKQVYHLVSKHLILPT